MIARANSFNSSTVHTAKSDHTKSIHNNNRFEIDTYINTYTYIDRYIHTIYVYVYINIHTYIHINVYILCACAVTTESPNPSPPFLYSQPYRYSYTAALYYIHPHTRPARPTKPFMQTDVLFVVKLISSDI